MLGSSRLTGDSSSQRGAALIATVVAAFLLVACQPNTTAAPTASPTPTAVAPPDAVALNAALETRVKALEDKVMALQVDKTMRELRDVNVAWFDPQEAKKYIPVKSPAGPVLLVLENVEPYLDGFKVTLRLGNPTSAGLSGIKGKITWGRAFDPKNPSQDPQSQTKQFDDPTFFPAGAWTYLSINIGPATANQARLIGVEPEFNQVSLRQPIR
jgi:hypothetical protein